MVDSQHNPGQQLQERVNKVSHIHTLDRLLSMETWAAAKKNFHLVWRCHQLLSGFLAKGHLPRVFRQSSRSLMIRVIMK